MTTPEILSFPDVISAAESLILILLFLLVAWLILKKIRGSQSRSPRLASSSIQVIASRSIGWQSSIMIIESQGSRFLVGASRGGITAIGALNTIMPGDTGDHK